MGTNIKARVRSLSWALNFNLRNVGVTMRYVRVLWGRSGVLWGKLGVLWGYVVGIEEML